MKILGCFEQIKQQLIDAGWEYNGLCYLKDDSHDFAMKVGYEILYGGDIIPENRISDINVVLNINFKTKRIEVLYGQWRGSEFYHRVCIGGSMLLNMCNNSEELINQQIIKEVAHVTRIAINAPAKYPRKEVFTII